MTVLPDGCLGCLGFLGFIFGGWIVWTIVSLVKDARDKRESAAKAAEKSQWDTNDPAKIAELQNVLQRVCAIPADRWTLTDWRREPSGRDVRTLSAKSERGAAVVFSEVIVNDRAGEYSTPVDIRLQIDGVGIGNFYYFSDHESGARAIKSAYDHAMGLIAPRLRAAAQAAEQQAKDEVERKRRNMMDRL